jgi:trehalose/maltose transport system permease protein
MLNNVERMREGGKRRAVDLFRRRRFAAWLFLAPLLVALSVVALWPLLQTFWFSFTDANLSQLEEARFIGWDNYLARDDGRYRGLLADPLWWRSVANTLGFAAISVFLETVLGFVVALVLNANFPGRGLVRAAVLIPWAIPTIVSAKIWSWLLNDQYGVINHVLLGLGLLKHPLAWTADPSLAMVSIIFVDVWKTTPFMALLILAGLQLLPHDCYEAAKIDGVPPWRVFVRVTLPLVRPAVMVAVIFRFLDALRIFDLVYVLTANSEETMSMSVYARRELVDFQQVGYGSAASTVLFLIVGLWTLLYLWLGRAQLKLEA